jgi:hypothetical protein
MKDFVRRADFPGTFKEWLVVSERQVAEAIAEAWADKIVAAQPVLGYDPHRGDFPGKRQC